MTDYKSTIAELRYLADWAKHHLDKAKIANDAAEAIEALQAENERLEAEAEENAVWPQWAERALKAIRKQTGNDGFFDMTEGVDLPVELDECLETLEAVIKERTAERDALQSRLDAMGKGEAIYQFKRGDGSWFDQTKASYDYNVKCGVSGLRIVYAAPKALALDVDWLANVIRQVDGNHKLGAGALAEKIVEAIAANGIHAKGGHHEP